MTILWYNNFREFVKDVSWFLVNDHIAIITFVNSLKMSCGVWIMTILRHYWLKMTILRHYDYHEFGKDVF